MPKFKNEETRLRGFNANAIQFAPGETKNLTTEQLDMLAKDASFVRLVETGDFVDIEGALPAAKSRAQAAAQAAKPDAPPASALASPPQFPAPSGFALPAFATAIPAGPHGEKGTPGATSAPLTGAPTGVNVEDVLARVRAAQSKEELAAVNASLPNMGDAYTSTGIGPAIAARASEIDAAAGGGHGKKGKG